MITSNEYCYLNIKIKIMLNNNNNIKIYIKQISTSNKYCINNKNYINQKGIVFLVYFYSLL